MTDDYGESLTDDGVIIRARKWLPVGSCRRMTHSGVDCTKVAKWKVLIGHPHTWVGCIVWVTMDVPDLVGKVYNLCRV